MSDRQRDECGCLSGYGHSHARVYTPPLGPLTPETTDGYRAIKFAELMGMALLPWQKWFLIHALEFKPGTKEPRFRTLVLLVARQQGKSTLSTFLMAYWLAVLKVKTIVVAAQDLSTAETMWEEAGSILNEHPLLRKEYVRDVQASGKKAYLYTGGRRIMPKASNSRAGRGGSVDRVFMDELREQKDWKAWAAIVPSTIARPGSQVLTASNAGDAEGVVLVHLHKSALSDIKEGNTDVSLGLFEWSAPEEMEITDVEAWRMAMPGLGRTVKEATIRGEMSTMPPNDFRTEYLCQFVDKLDQVVDLVAWAETADPIGDLRNVFARRELHLAVQVGTGGDHVSLIGAGALNDDRGRVRLQVLKTWSGPNAAKVATKELAEAVALYRPRTLSWYPTGPGAVLKVPVSKIKGTKVVPVAGPDTASVCMDFALQVSGRAVLHDNSPVMATQLIAAQRQDVGDGWRFEVKGIGAHVDALYAAAGAVRQARLQKSSGGLGLITADDE